MNNISKTHLWIKSHLHSNSHIIDMTCGNGHDTKFLAQNAKKVTAIDIQAQAIKNTQKRCREFNNIHYILENHALVDYKALEPIHGVVYNLGYLPHGDKSIITKTESTLASLEKVFPYVKDFLVITVYPGHPQGDIEAEKVYKWIQAKELNPTIYRYNTKKSPIAYCIAL